VPKSQAPRKPRKVKELPAAPKLKVTVSYVHSDAGRVTAFEECYVDLVGFDARRHGFMQHEGSRLPIRCGTDGLVAARNSAAVQLLASDSDYLLWIDTDMGFAPDALYRLLQVAHPVDRPIVGGLCFMDRHVHEDGMHGFRTRPSPTIFAARLDDDGVPRTAVVPMYPVNAVMRVAATGSAFILIHRSVFEKMSVAFGPTWYERVMGPEGTLLGEDVSFCMRALELDIPVHVHTGVRTTHYKSRWLSEIDHWRNYNPPPATDEVAVIIPTHRRPQNAEPLMRSLRASTGLATAYAVVDADDPEAAEAWSVAGAEVIASADVEFAKKANLGYAKTSQPWAFLVGDDVKFHPGWLDHAQHVASSLEASVVGTNDLGNPRVMSGEHATHLLIRRSYVDEVGAGWDGPGVLCHEGYRHWFVDDELVVAAKQRGVWQMALGSVVEHLHPLWGKGVKDDVYDIGPDNMEADRLVFEARLAANR